MKDEGEVTVSGEGLRQNKKIRVREGVSKVSKDCILALSSRGSQS